MVNETSLQEINNQINDINSLQTYYAPYLPSLISLKLRIAFRYGQTTLIIPNGSLANATLHRPVWRIRAVSLPKLTLIALIYPSLTCENRRTCKNIYNYLGCQDCITYKNTVFISL